MTPKRQTAIPSAARSLLAAFAIASLLSAPLAAQADYRFFVGTDIDVVLDKDYYRVANFQNNVLTAVADDERISIPLQKAKLLRTSRSPKISASYAQLEQVEVKQAYSPRNDPNLQWQSAVSAMQSQARDQEDQVRANAMARVQSAALSGGNTTEAMQQGMAEIEASIESTNRIDDMSSDMPANLEGSYDAVDLTVTVRSEDELQSPYLVALIKYLDPKTGLENVRPLFQPVEPPLHEGNQIRIFAAGFPGNFQLMDATVALFDQGREIATNLSEKQVAVTREQALLYLRFERKNDNPGVTLPAKPIRGFVPPGFADSLPQNLGKASVTLAINAEGDVTRLARTDGGALPPDLEPLIRSIPFYPALESGSPADSSLTLTLAELLR